MSSINIGFIGDSITYGFLLPSNQVTNPAPTTVGLALAKLQGVNSVTMTNQGVSGSQTSDWVQGQVNYTSAVSAFQAAGTTIVSIMLGTNDCKTSVLRSPNGVNANLENLCQGLIANGIQKIILNSPPYIINGASAYTAPSFPLLVAYQNYIQTLADNVKVFSGDTVAYSYFQANQSEIQGDDLHPSQVGYNSLAVMWTEAYRRNFLRDSAPFSWSITNRTSAGARSGASSRTQVTT